MLISGVYRPQTINEKTFNDDFIKTCDKITIKYDNFMYIGDLNYDFLRSEKMCTIGRHGVIVICNRNRL